MSDSYDRPIWQIALKTVVTHAFALIVYNQFSSLLHVPSKHNARLFRLVAFTLVPTVLLGQFAFNLVKAAVRVLQKPHELDLTNHDTKRALKFYWDGILGVRSISASHNDTTEPAREETFRLLDVTSTSDVQPQRVIWNWKRTRQLFVVLLGIAQASAVVVLFVRRAVHNGGCQEFCSESSRDHCDGSGKYWRCYEAFTTGIDFRNLYIACASIISGLLSMYLIIAGNTWTSAPVSLSLSGEGENETSAVARSSAVPGEFKHLILEFIIGAAIQEFIAVQAYYESDGAPDYPTSLMHVLDRVHLSALGWVLLILVVGLLAIFRNDIASRLGLKIDPATLVLRIGMVVLGVWFTVDAVGVVVTDLGHFIDGTYKWNLDTGGERWMDPVEKWVPFI